MRNSSAKIAIIADEISALWRSVRLSSITRPIHTPVTPFPPPTISCHSSSVGEKPKVFNNVCNLDAIAMTGYAFGL